MTLASSAELLTDPFLQYPTSDSVRVVWFTEFPGVRHWVNYGRDLELKAIATSQKLSRLREDTRSRIPTPPTQPTFRPIWRHEALITPLTPGQRLPYQVTSLKTPEDPLYSAVFTLTPTPPPGTPLKILLTSDHQLMPMTAANLQKVVETIGFIDGVFLAGDLTNIPDRASEWFDDQRGGAFFPCLQGRAQYTLEKNEQTTLYQGGQIIQNAPLFPALGNHEVMGRFSMTEPLGEQFNHAYPREQAEAHYAQQFANLNIAEDPTFKAAWIKANSFNTDTYEEIFSLPEHSPGGKKYYAITFGDVRLIVLYITNIWRVPSLDDTALSRYREPTYNLQNPEKWGYGQHIFESIQPGSSQYEWLINELDSPEFKRAKYKIVMFHHPPHTLGGNIVPAYTNPRQTILTDPTGQVQKVRYEYPLEDDHIIQHLEPLLTEKGVHLVYYGHSHLWNRFRNKAGVNFLESSNIGNSYGAYFSDEKRPIPEGYQATYVATGNPNGLEPIVPTIDPLFDEQGQPLPYIASNDITVFSILDTQKGTISSYRFDTRQPMTQVVKFDEFDVR
nr:metallophosphoesterase family protein [Spirulina subsalsa]